MVEETIFQKPADELQTESIELEVTAKGLYKWILKVRNPQLNEETFVRLVKFNEMLKLQYPNNVMNVAKEEKTK